MRKNNRERILETARLLLPRYGYRGISIRAIAARARLTTGAIYFHFKNKREIYRTICFEAVDMLVDKFRRGIATSKTPNQKLISTFDSYIAFFYENRDYYNILMEYKADYNVEGADDGRTIAGKIGEMIDVMKDVIEQGISDGVFRKLDPSMLSFFLATVTEGMLQFKQLGMFEHLGINDRDFRYFMANVIGYGIQQKASGHGERSNNSETKKENYA